MAKQPLSVVTPYDDIEVPIEPVAPIIGALEDPVPPPEEVPYEPIGLPVWDEEAITGLMTVQAQEQHAKDQLVTLAAAVTHMQEEVTELRARVAQLESNA